MKKQIKRLSLNKKTISNLSVAEMNRQLGGDKTKGKAPTCITCTCRNSGCPGFNTCDATQCWIG